MLNQSKIFYLAISFSLLLHILFILGVKIQPDYTKFLRDKIPPLEVVIVSNPAEKAPPQASLLAQTNHDADAAQAKQEQRKSSPPPVDSNVDKKTVAKLEKLSKRVDKIESSSREKQAQVKQLENQAKNLLHQLQSQPVIENTPAPSANNNEAAAQPKKLNLSTADLLASNEEISRSEAQIARQQEDYQRRPRRKSVGIRTQEYKFAIYVEAWRQKVERIGNLNYPAAAREQKLYGNLQMTVYIKSDGSLEKVEIRRSSGHRVLDDAARRIVELAAPYAPFPEDIRKEVDVLDITRTWTFTKEDSFNGGD
ncbi:MAG: energy transducer TonB [Candidatus Methylopumilus sp.]|jgi:protein TonB|nr:energy transducer TonB [Candidatus Methylopumilus sp.]